MMGEIRYGGDGSGKDVNPSYSVNVDTGIGSTELFWNDNNGHEVNPNYYCGTLSLIASQAPRHMGLVPTKQCDPDECRSRPMTRQAGLTNQRIHLGSSDETLCKR
jgi:hypothetical protein